MFLRLLDSHMTCTHAAPLAEVYIKVDESSEDIYCLCSRVVIRGKIEEDYFDQEIFEEEEIEEVETKTQPQTEAKKKEEEVSSCYCSASHCSTDEHDSVLENALHSDSGADISEGSRDFEFDRYWAVNGERIVWESWITKYGEYIDPTYFNEGSVQKNSFAGLIDVNEESEKQNPDLLQLEGHEQDIASESDCGDDYFRLRSCSRSSKSSIITDSLTNVTPMTIYSSEFSYGGEESLQSSNSILSSSESVSSNDQQWQQLWMEHFNEQYESSYRDFVTKIDNKPQESNQFKSTIKSHTDKPFISRNQVQSVGYLLGSLKSLSVDKESLTAEEMDSSISDAVNDSCASKCCDSETTKSSDVSTVIACESHRNVKNLKRAHDKDDPSLERVKGAFTLMGFVFKPAEPEPSSIKKAHVIYRKRNIRSHNRSLILKSAQPRHIRFNENGEPIKDNPGDEPDNAAQLVRSLEPDNFSEKDDSSSDEDVSLPMEDWSSVNYKQKEKQKKKRMSKKKGKSWKANLPKEIFENTKLLKYWYNRYRLFSKFDDGIKLDEESWYSVTPEKVSKHTAERCRSDLIIDACCGAGGNTIQFAFTCQRVVAIDIDPSKIALAKHNAAIYGVEDRIEFIVGDFLELAPKLKADVVFLSPPWGGPSYLTNPTYCLQSIGTTGGGRTLYEAAFGITQNIAYFLPKNVNTDELVKMVGPGGSIEVEQNFLDKKLVAVTAYFGELVEPV